MIFGKMFSILNGFDIGKWCAQISVATQNWMKKKDIKKQKIRTWVVWVIWKWKRYKTVDIIQFMMDDQGTRPWGWTVCFFKGDPQNSMNTTNSTQSFVWNFCTQFKQNNNKIESNWVTEKWSHITHKKKTE